MSALGTALITDPTQIFFVVLAIILFAPMLLSRLHFPHIIGLILAGILVGPYGFHVLERDSSFELFGQVGIYYIMFLAGLELDMGSVQRYGRRGIYFGLLTFGIPFVLGFLAGRYLLGYSAPTSLLLSCILASHTLVSYPIVGRYGMARHRIVVVSVVATAFATFMALLAVALVVGSQKPDTSMSTWLWFALKCAAYGTFVIMAYPRLGRWFLRRYDDSVMQYIFILALVFLSAALAEAAGLEGLLGAFLAGLVVNRLIPHASPLMTRIEFVGNALFIPYFLIGVGMIINVRAFLGQTDTLWAIAVITATATFTKWLAAWITARTTGEGRDAIWMMFGLTNAHAAGALAIVMIGTSAAVNLMDASVLNATVMLILFSCIISGLATSQGARQIALSDTTLEDNRGSYHGKCLVTYSQADNVDMMTQLAILIRNPYIADSLMGLSVTFDNEEGEDMHRQGKRLLEKAKSIAASADVRMKTLSRMSTNIASGILHTMKEYDVGEVVVCLTDRETGMAKASLGNVIDNVLNGSHREVMAIRAIVPPGTLRQVVVVVPQKAEYEVGFYKWLEHLCRIGEQTGCRMEFRAHPDTMHYIQGYMGQKHPRVRASYVPMPRWNDLRKLYGQLGPDQMLVVVTARPGFISYTTALDLLPKQISQHFSQTSIMLLYPDQWGDPLETVSVFAPNGTAVTRQPHTIGSWLRRLLFRSSAALSLFLCALALSFQSQPVAAQPARQPYADGPSVSQKPALRKMSTRVQQSALRELARQASPANPSARRVPEAASTTSSPSLCAFVRTSDPSVLALHGGRLLARWGTLCIAEIPLCELASLSNRTEVKRIEAGPSSILTMDTALIITQAAALHQPQPNQTAYTGKGVVMGIMDVGFDLTHPNFYSRDLSEYRIKAFWDQLDTTQCGNGQERFVGQEYTTEEAILQKGCSTDGRILSHGTHTAGVAAGSGYDSPYIGAAPQADLCLVSNAVSKDLPLIPEENVDKYTTATDVLGFKYIFDYADRVKKPCVISFSEGTIDDLYGDSQLFHEALDSLVGPGRIICSSSGNRSNYLTYLHKQADEEEAGTLLSLDGKSAFYYLRAPELSTTRLSFMQNPGTVVYEYLIETADILAQPDSMRIDTITAGPRTYQIVTAAYPSCYNPAEWATELLVQDLTEEKVANLRIGLKLTGTDLEAEAFALSGAFASSSDYKGYQGAEASHNIMSPSAAPSVICVGSSAWRTGILNYQNVWQNFNFGQNGEVGRHSSVGPTMSGLTKPEVIAPGVNIISSYSSFFLESNKETEEWNLGYDISRFQFRGREYSWNAQSGTSMSSPIVGGIIALWLQACPTLTREQVVEVLAHTCRHHDEALSYPNNSYGFGEIDAQAGLEYILKHYAGVDDVAADGQSGPIIARYDLSGRRISLESPGNGIYIEKFANGNVRKTKY